MLVGAELFHNRVDDHGLLVGVVLNIPFELPLHVLCRQDGAVKDLLEPHGDIVETDKLAAFVLPCRRPDFVEVVSFASLFRKCLVEHIVAALGVFLVLAVVDCALEVLVHLLLVGDFVRLAKAVEVGDIFLVNLGKEVGFALTLNAAVNHLSVGDYSHWLPGKHLVVAHGFV